MSKGIFDRESSNTDLWQALAACFLGPKAENREELNQLATSVLNIYEDYRKGYQPTDPSYITDETRLSTAFIAKMHDLRNELMKMNEKLQQSVPFFSPRYKGHMIWDVTLPSLLGYLSGMLWNQNNVDSSTSPVTTEFETTVAKQLCDMLGFSTDESSKPWGHITSCGTISNIEALWAARNLKYQPIALQNAVRIDQSLFQAKMSYHVYVPRLQREILLSEAEVWDLLNLDIDDVCNMTGSVATAAGITMTTLTAILDEYSIVSLGIKDFAASNSLQKTPVFFSPVTNHYSWPKAATLLGIGDKNVIHVSVDGNGRQSIRELEKKLNECLDREIPVIAVVAIIGSTEESAVDSVEEIIKLRQKFRSKGLNFCIHADAAWGGYLMTMLKEPTCSRSGRHWDENRKVHEKIGDYHPLTSRTSEPIHAGEHHTNSIENLVDRLQSSYKVEKSVKIQSSRMRHRDFVGTIQLSPYVESQFQAIKDVDTVTIDPHKAGFCLYPSGALCYRNGRMRGFITLAAPEVFHSENDPSVGVYGLEGSKPGAAACSVLLSHNVIGLHKLGYGQILGQCQFGAKLFYCMWMTIAKANDPFICCNFIDVKSENVADCNRFIKERILGRANREIFKDTTAIQFLTEIGPDALINTFGVNMKNKDGSLNKDVEIYNQLQTAIFEELSGHVGQSTKRIPMFLTASVFDAVKYGTALDQFKKRLGLFDESSAMKQNLKFLRNTVINPFQSSQGMIEKLGQIFRNTVLNCIGKLQDLPCMHIFVCCNVGIDDTIFMAYLPSFAYEEKRYTVIVKVKVVDEMQGNLLRSLQSSVLGKPLFLRTSETMSMFDLLHSESDVEFDLCTDPKVNSRDFELKHVRVMLEEIIKYDHFEPDAIDLDYPVWQSYFLFGNQRDAYLLHSVTRKPNFFQLVQLDRIPDNVPFSVLDIGIEVSVLGLPGHPTVICDKIQDTLPSESFTIQFNGLQGQQTRTIIKTHRKNAKIWFEEIF